MWEGVEAYVSLMFQTQLLFFNTTDFLRVGIFAVELESAFCGFGSSKSLKTLVPGAKINLFQVILDIKIDGDCIFWVH